MEQKLLLKFKRNESFYIREGWFEKAINAIKDKDDVFSKNNGVQYLGIGSAMVKSLKYWLSASHIIESTQVKTTLSEFGELIYQYDRYCESDFVWFLIHYFLTTNLADCPIHTAVFSLDVKSFKKQDMLSALEKWFSDKDYSGINMGYVEEDLNIFLKSYVYEHSDANPEDNYVCPLANLKLVKRSSSGYTKSKVSYASLSYLIVYYAIFERYKNEKNKAFNIEDVFNEELSVCKIFNLDRNQFLQYLDEMKNHGFVTINKTAGLNTVYLDKNITLRDIFELEFIK